MCGNGLRCVARYLAARRGDGAWVIDTDSGPRRCQVQGERVSIGMGPSSIEGSVEAEVKGQRVSLLRVSMGNPHAITFEPLPFDELAPSLSTHEVFPQGANVEFVTEDEGALRVRVWERGAGPTLACGTGACAAVVAGIRRGLLESPVRVATRGGELAISWNGGANPVHMTGPAATVFSAEIELPDHLTNRNPT